MEMLLRRSRVGSCNRPRYIVSVAEMHAGVYREIEKEVL
jgi:hypothetical protein